MSVLALNRGRVAAITGTVDQGLAACISDMLDEPNFPTLPKTDDPKAENSNIVGLMKEIPSEEVPTPFLMAVLQQESGLEHYNEPSRNDEDTYIVIGLDTKTDKHIITSRGYGAGQYTLFHHPPKKKRWKISCSTLARISKKRRGNSGKKSTTT